MSKLDEDKDFSETLDHYLNVNRMHHFEGEMGVRKICKLVSALGYQDEQGFRQFSGGCYGDLISFLEDNPGACEALVEWIRETGDEMGTSQNEWLDNLSEAVGDAEEED